MAKALTNDQIRTIPEEDCGVVILGGEAYRIIDNRYVLDEEAQVIFQERLVKRETEKLAQMEQALYKKAAELKEKSDQEKLAKEKEEKELADKSKDNK